MNPNSSGSANILFTRLLYYTKRQSRKREIIQPNIYRISPKVNQVIYTFRHALYANYQDPSSCGSPDILFTRFHRFTMQKSNKGHTAATSPTKKKIRDPLFSCLFCIYIFKILSLTVLGRIQVKRMDRPKPIRPLFFEVGGIKIEVTF